MDNVKIVIVDDSPFSITLLRDILEENGLEVVGDAGTLEEVKKVVKEKKPTLVTMDMTLPGTDGLECTRAIHEIDENIKVIVISSMMDDEIVEKAKKNHVSDYLQKPVDPEELITAIKKVVAAEELYNNLENDYTPVFKEALLDAFNRMTKTVPTYVDEYSTNKEFESKGISIIIGIIGKFSGRMLLDLSKETAESLTSALLRRQPKNNDELLAALGEFSNIIAGNACSILNRKNKALGLRVAPPSILHGESLHVSAPKFNTTSALSKTQFGEILINIGFKRGEEKWM
ncbi:MAG: response regulator [Clostridiaceae bacterium]